MTDLIEALHSFDTALRQTAPKIANRLQAGLSDAEIEAQAVSFAWQLPQDAHDLHQWHNGLSGKPAKSNLAEKLLRLKGKWHGELFGRENEIHLQLYSSRAAPPQECLTIAKFLPLNYALAGHRHLKLGGCSIDLLPFAILRNSNSNSTIYCMLRLDSEQPIVYCADGTRLPPRSVTEPFLSTQPQFDRLSDLIAFLTEVFWLETIGLTQSIGLNDNVDYAIDLMQFNQRYQQQKPNT